MDNGQWTMVNAQYLMEMHIVPCAFVIVHSVLYYIPHEFLVTAISVDSGCAVGARARRVECNERRAN